jgi:hypothetical protein
MKRILLFSVITALLIASSQNVKAQYYFYNDEYYDNPVLFEAGLTLGAMNCLTDLGGKKGIGKRFIKDLNTGQTHAAGGAFFTAFYKNAAALRIEAMFGKVSADDADLEAVDLTDIAKTRFNRNCNFQSKISEYSAVIELHPLFMFINWEDRDQDPPRYSPYLLGGIGYYSFNPQATLNGRLVDLQPLSTEGQGFKEYPNRKPYKLKQTNIPVGIGVKYELSSLFNLRAEYVYRLLSTDYLDDVSTTYVDPNVYQNYFTGVKLANAIALSDRQINKVTVAGGKRGSPKEKDAYFSFNLKLSLILGRERIR